MMVTWLLYGRACGMNVYRMWKEGNRMRVPPEAMLATARSASELQPDFQSGSKLARWLPGLVCREGKYCVHRYTSKLVF